jgi:hypothetical protein
MCEITLPSGADRIVSKLWIMGLTLTLSAAASEIVCSGIRRTTGIFVRLQNQTK